MQLGRAKVFGGCIGVIVAPLTLAGCNMDVLHPAGPVGNIEARLLAETTAAMLIIVIPVIIMTIVFAWRYRDGANHSHYNPQWNANWRFEAAIWFIPLLIVIYLGILNWRSTLALDPFKPLPGNRPVLRVDVVAMDWKWLFIYPDQRIATIDQLVIPTGTQVAFDITSDTVMNVFFIPRLGTQIYAMAGMRTQDHLLAKDTGTFRGISANFSGDGFAQMRFQTKAVTPDDFAVWVRQTQDAPQKLDAAAFAQLRKPGVHDAPAVYGRADPTLFTAILHERDGTQMPTMKNPTPSAKAQ
jgi:cytochrome o ubiquinol oxidase subunit 2